MKKLLTLSTLLLLGAYGCDVSEKSQTQSQTQSQPKLQKKDITRVCSVIANTPKYLAEQKFTEEYYKLQDLAGHDTYYDGFALGIFFSGIELTAYVDGIPWSWACEKNLEKKFKEDL